MLGFICRCPVTTANVIAEGISRIFKLLLACIFGTVHRLAVCFVCVLLLAKTLLDKLLNWLTGKLAAIKLWAGQQSLLARLKACLLWLPQTMKDCISRCRLEKLSSGAEAKGSYCSILRQCVLWIPLKIKAVISTVLGSIFGLVGSTSNKRPPVLLKEKPGRKCWSVVKASLLWLPAKVEVLIGMLVASVLDVFDSVKHWGRENECAVLYQPVEQLKDESPIMVAMELFIDRFNRKARYELKPKDHYNVYDATASPLTKLLLVPCLVCNDRLLTDVTMLIRSHNFPEGTGTARMVLVVLQQRENIESHITPTSSILGCVQHAEKFQEIVDVVFTPRRGVYKCPQNDSAVRQLAEICKAIGIKHKADTASGSSSSSNNSNMASNPRKRSHSLGKVFKSIP